MDARTRARRVGFGLVAVLIGGYLALNRALLGHMGQRSAVAPESVSPALAMSSGQVPTTVQDRLIAKLGNVVQTDELAFFPLAGHRVGVYATVDLGDTSSDLTSTDLATMAQDTQAWFTDVYSPNLNQQIADAEVYFMLNGRLVGGAGLGINAYQRLSETTGATGNSSGLVSSLREDRQVSGEGIDESWYEVSSLT